MKEFQKKNLRQTFLVSLMVLIFAVALPACSREIGADGPYGYLTPEFSPDGKLLAFNLCAKKECDSVIYDIAAQTYTAFVDQEGSRINSLTFSPDGKRVAFIVLTKGKWPWQDSTQQVAVGTPDGKSLRIVTTGDGAKVSPTFWNNDSVMFWAEILVSGVAGDYKVKQLHMVDVDSKNRRTVIPMKFHFSGPSAPRPMGDSDHIILSDYGFAQPEVRLERLKMSYEEKKHIKNHDEILLLSQSKQTVAPLITGLQDSIRPVVALKTGQMFFQGRLESNEGQKGYAYEVYVQDGDGARRITQLRTYMSDMDVTMDGKTLALVLATSNWQQPDGRGKLENGRLLLYDIQTHTYRELNPKDISKVSVQIQN